MTKTTRGSILSRLPKGQRKHDFKHHSLVIKRSFPMIDLLKLITVVTIKLKST